MKRIFLAYDRTITYSIVYIITNNEEVMATLAKNCILYLKTIFLLIFGNYSDFKKMTFVQKPNCAVPNNKALTIKTNINNATGLKRKRYYPHNSTINITEN